MIISKQTSNLNQDKIFAHLVITGYLHGNFSLLERLPLSEYIYLFLNVYLISSTCQCYQNPINKYNKEINLIKMLLKSICFNHFN